jgi:hypothetical protein
MTMKIGTVGAMNIDFSETYDQEDDVYYVTFKTGEPSYCVEVDDVFLLEVGLFSNLPTGFRILNFHRNNVQAVGIKVEPIKRITDALSKKSLPAIKQRQAVFERAIEKVLA